jgi:tRNA dimethylallyltransferase
MNAASRPLAVFLAGPTASGKTRLTLELAGRFPFEVISVDAAQVYRGMDIGTAKPTLEERRQVPHRLIDIRDPAEIYSVADFRADALRAMQEITAAGKIPLLSGGTMFYFNALEHGLPDLPTADEAIRERLEGEAREVGWRVLHDRLKALDPDRAARIHPNDPQRTLRALEIIELSGRTASSYRRGPVTDFPYRVLKLYLYPEDRAWLHDRIAQRFTQMLEQGFLEEARVLFARPDLNPALPSLRSVGYRQAGLYLSGEINYDALSERVVIATRQLAKRQMTWIRSDTTAERIECSGSDPLLVVQQRLHAELE